MFQFLNRTDTKDRYTDRPKPQIPDFRDAPKYEGHVEQAIDYLEMTTGVSDDFVLRIMNVHGRSACMLFFKTIVDEKTVETLLSAIQDHHFPRRIPKNQYAQYMVEKVLPASSAIFVTNMWEIREALAEGQVVLLIDGVSPAITVQAISVAHRNPDVPITESSSRGPQISFVEEVEINIGLLRRFLATDALHVKEIKVGYRSKTKVAVVYQPDVANPITVDTVLKRISAVHVDKITGSAVLEQRIIDHHWTMFPLTRATVRVDSTIKEIGQGKVCIVVDGDPMVLLVPGTIIDFFQTMEDDQHSYVEATFVRLLRVVSFIIAMFLPALYISFSDFNPELLPHVLGLQIARSREGVPFNAAVEVTVMQIVIEILREATLRMPKAMGQTIGIVGGLVLGEAAVQAGLVSNILIIVIALTALATFVTPSYEFASVLRIETWIMVIGASIFGLYGVLLMTLGILLHVASLKSFGVSYLDPITGEHFRDFFLDGILRAPIPILDKRAAHLHARDVTRSADYTDPVPHPLVDKADKNPKRKRRSST